MTTVIAFAKSILIALTAACGVSGPAENNPDEVQPPQQTEEDKHFCCTSVDVSGKGTGEGCIGIPDDNAIINACSYVVYCPEGWAKADGKVTCS